MRILLRNLHWHLLIAGLSLLFPVLLYRARHLDDNALTSWQWAFQVVEASPLWWLLVGLTPLFWLLAMAPEWWKKIGVKKIGVRHQFFQQKNWCLTPIFFFPIVIFSAALVACLYFLPAPEVIVDAARYFVQAKSFSDYGPLYFYREWGGAIFAWTDLPLMSALYGLLFTVFGESRLAVQLLNALFFALSTLLIAQLGRDLWDEETGRAGALLFLGFPYLYSQTPLLLVDIGTMFFLLLALASWYRAISLGGGYLVLAGGAIVAVCLSKYSAWLLLSGLLPLFFCALGPAGALGPALRRAVLTLGPALLIIGLLFWGQREVMGQQLALLLSFQRPALAGWSEGLVSTFFFQTHPLLTIALLYSFYRAGRRRDLRYLAVAWLVVLVLVIMELRRIRYSIPIFPLLALMAGYGLRDLADPGLRRHLLLVVAGSSLLLAGGAFLPFLHSMAERNLQQAGGYLDTLPLQPVAVVILAEPDPAMDPRVTLPLLDMFTNQPLYQHPLSQPPPPPPELTSSPLRFTWEMDRPPFYRPPTDAGEPTVLVVIRGGPAAHRPAELVAKLANYRKLQEFDQDSGIFRHRPLVTVYARPTPPDVPRSPDGAVK